MSEIGMYDGVVVSHVFQISVHGQEHTVRRLGAYHSYSVAKLAHATNKKRPAVTTHIHKQAIIEYKTLYVT